jgi:hypothetical protein
MSLNGEPLNKTTLLSDLIDETILYFLWNLSGAMMCPNLTQPLWQSYLYGRFWEPFFPQRNHNTLFIFDSYYQIHAGLRDHIFSTTKLKKPSKTTPLPFSAVFIDNDMFHFIIRPSQ